MTTPERGGICEWTEFGSSRVCGNPLPCGRHSTDHEGHPFGFTNLADRPTPTSETPAAPSQRDRLAAAIRRSIVTGNETPGEMADRILADPEAAALAARPALDVERLATAYYNVVGQHRAPVIPWPLIAAEYARLAPQEPTPEEPA